MARIRVTAAVFLLLFSSIPECRGDENLLGVAAGIAPCIEEILEIFACQEQGELSLAKSPCSALASQLLSGAPYDMIIFSDPKWADWLEEKGLVQERRVLSLHPLALWWQGEEPPGRSVLCSGKIACPLPETTAFGALAKRFLQESGLWDSCIAEERLIFVRGAPQAALAVVSGSACAAFLPFATTRTKGCRRGSCTLLQVPPIEQVAVLVPGADTAARRFFDFCSSETALSVWSRWGFYESN